MSQANGALAKNGHAAAASAMPVLRLKWVGTLDFRHTDANQLDEIIKAVGTKLGKSDCAIIVSKLGKVLRFIFGAIEHDMVNVGGRYIQGRKTRVVASRTYRIVEGGVFSPYMLQNYANDLGFELAHLKRLEAHLKAEAFSAHEGGSR